MKYENGKRLLFLVLVQRLLFHVYISRMEDRERERPGQAAAAQLSLSQQMRMPPRSSPAAQPALLLPQSSMIIIVCERARVYGCCRGSWKREGGAVIEGRKRDEEIQSFPGGGKEGGGGGKRRIGAIFFFPFFLLLLSTHVRIFFTLVRH